MKFERKWNETVGQKTKESWKEISEDRANRELANAHGDKAAEKLKKEGELETRFGVYRFTE